MATSTGTTRVLVAARLSRGVGEDEKSRIDRDDEAAEKWAAGREGCTIVTVTKDAGVSGGTSPWKRPSLGPWLTDPALIAQYDEIVASSIDRLGRSARDMHDLRSWAEDQGKVIRIQSPPLTWPVAADDIASRIIWPVLETLAEIELRTTTKRYADAKNTILDNEALFGRPPWGYIVIGEKYSKTIAPDPTLVPYLHGMIERALNGEPYLSICRWLDGEGVKTDKGAKWSPKSVANILRNQALKGRRVDADGHVLLKFDSIMTSAEWARLQAALDARPSKRGPITSETAPLTGVIECEHCGRPMYRFRSKTPRKDGTSNVLTYYRCKGTDSAPSTCKNMIPLDEIEQWVDQWFTQDGFGLSSVEIIETVTVPGDDHLAEVAEIEADIRALDLDAPNYDEQLRALRTERNRLKALPSEPTQVIERPTGITVGEVWQSLDDEARRSYLMAAGVKVRVSAMPKDTDDVQYGGGRPRYITGDPHKVIGILRSITHSEG